MKKLLVMLSIISLFVFFSYLFAKSDGKCVSGNCINGEGNFHYTDGRIYKGDFKNGKRHGKGNLTSPKGYEYKGQWKNGKPYGEGALYDPNGDSYVGQWKNGKKHGKGTFTYANGDEYVGQWKNGKWHGEGTYTFTDGDKYVGQFKNGKYHGKGTYTFDDGRKYVGQWKNDKYHGKGTITYADGRTLVGRWKNGKLILKPKYLVVADYFEWEYCKSSDSEFYDNTCIKSMKITFKNFSKKIIQSIKFKLTLKDGEGRIRYKATHSINIRLEPGDTVASRFFKLKSAVSGFSELDQESDNFITVDVLSVQ